MSERSIWSGIRRVKKIFSEAASPDYFLDSDSSVKILRHGCRILNIISEYLWRSVSEVAAKSAKNAKRKKIS
jgi:hypothetical protein